MESIELFTYIDLQNACMCGVSNKFIYNKLLSPLANKIKIERKKMDSQNKRKRKLDNNNNAFSNLNVVKNRKLETLKK